MGRKQHRECQTDVPEVHEPVDRHATARAARRNNPIQGLRSGVPLVVVY